MNTAKTACALFQCAQLWSAAACTAPLCEWGKMFSEASSGTKCYRECNPFPAEVWLARGVPSMPKLPTVSSSHAATQLHPKPGVKEITVACCSCLIRRTDALGSLKFSPAAVLPWWCRFWLQSSSHLLATRAVLLLLAQVMWVQTPVLILLFCGDSRRFFLPELLIWKINREVFCRDYLCKVLSGVLLKGVCKNQLINSIRHKEICHKESAEELTTVPEKHTLNCSQGHRIL